MRTKSYRKWDTRVVHGFAWLPRFVVTTDPASGYWIWLERYVIHEHFYGGYWFQHEAEATNKDIYRCVEVR